jgi:hypothetical protein
MRLKDKIAIVTGATCSSGIVREPLTKPDDAGVGQICCVRS